MVVQRFIFMCFSEQGFCQNFAHKQHPPKFQLCKLGTIYIYSEILNNNETNYFVVFLAIKI